MSNQSQKEKIRSENPLLMSGVRADWATPGVAQSTFLTWDKEVYPEPGCCVIDTQRNCVYFLIYAYLHVVLIRTFTILQTAGQAFNEKSQKRRDF